MVCFVGMWSFPPKTSRITACRAALTKGVASALTKNRCQTQGPHHAISPRTKIITIIWGDLGRLVANICSGKSLSPLSCSYRLDRLKPKHHRWFWERGGDVWEQILYDFLLFPYYRWKCSSKCLTHAAEFSPTSMVSCGFWRFQKTDPRVPTPSSTNFSLGSFEPKKNRVEKMLVQNTLSVKFKSNLTSFMFCWLDLSQTTTLANYNCPSSQGPKKSSPGSVD